MCPPRRFAIHRSQENIFEGVAPLMHAADRHSLFRRNHVEISGLDMLRNYQLDATTRKSCALASKPSNTHRKFLGCTDGLKLNEAAVRTALLFYIAESRDAAVLENQHLIAYFIDIAQQ